MSWKERALAPITGMLVGMLAAVGIWFAFFEYDPSTSGGFFTQMWQSVVDNVEIIVVVAAIGGALGLPVGIFIAIFGGRS
jgi:ABC-type phosphate transport system permease subunit